MNVAAVKTALKLLFVAAVPPPPIMVDEWADAHRYIPLGASSRPGKWVTRPYQREPMQCVSPQHPSTLVILQCAAQVLKTELIINKAGHTIHIHPAPMLIVEARDDDATFISRSRITPMIENCPELRDRVLPAKSRATGNTTWSKSYPGGELVMVGAQTPSNLAMRSIRDLMLDEVDRFPISVGKEGDPIGVALARCENWGDSRKVVMASTPTSKRTSRIHAEYLRSDQRRYHVPCPKCAHFQPLDWSQVVWGVVQDDALVFDETECALPANSVIPVKQAHYRCVSCDVLIPHWRKSKMVEKGKWVAANPNSPVPGFQLSRLYAPERTWGDLALDYVGHENNPEKMRVFYNTILGEPWDDGDATPDFELLYLRQIRDVNWVERLPRGVMFLTGAIDVQANRLEWLVRGWDRRLRSWAIEHVIVPGDTKEPKVWEDLSASIRKRYIHAGGMPIEVSVWAIDHNYNSHKVEEWARDQALSEHAVDLIMVYGVQSLRSDQILGAPGSLNSQAKSRVVVKSATTYPINTHRVKSELYAALNQKYPGPDVPVSEHPPFYCFYSGQSIDFFKQLTAETFEITMDRNGYPTGKWVKSINDRNEILDLHGYCRGGVEYLRVSEWSDEVWASLEDKYNNYEQGLAEIVKAKEDTSTDRGWIPRRKGWFK